MRRIEFLKQTLVGAVAVVFRFADKPPAPPGRFKLYPSNSLFPSNTLWPS
jgi:hypothetical protein